MKKYLSVLQKSPLFYGIRESEIESMLSCLDAKKMDYAKNESILRVGEYIESIGILLSGTACILQEDFWGNRNLIRKIAMGESFAEAFACTENSVLNISVIAESNTEVMFLNLRRLLTVCSSACVHHSRVIRNLLSDIAVRNLQLNAKLTHMAQRTTRAKLLSFLSAESQRSRSASFDINLNRQQLADYLSVDRSAMSNELCKLRDEGILLFDKNHFELIQNI